MITFTVYSVRPSGGDEIRENGYCDRDGDRSLRAAQTRADTLALHGLRGIVRRGRHGGRVYVSEPI